MRTLFAAAFLMVAIAAESHAWTATYFGSGVQFGSVNGSGPVRVVAKTRYAGRKIELTIDQIVGPDFIHSVATAYILKRQSPAYLVQYLNGDFMSVSNSGTFFYRDGSYRIRGHASVAVGYTLVSTPYQVTFAFLNRSKRIKGTISTGAGSMSFRAKL